MAFPFIIFPRLFLNISSVIQNDWFSAMLIFKKTPNQYVQNILRVCERTLLTTLWCASQRFGSFGMMPACDRVRRCTTLQCCLGSSSSKFPNVFCTCSSTPVDKFGFMLDSQRQPYFSRHYLPLTWTASGLPMLGHWDVETRCVLRKTMRSVVLSLTSNGNPSNPALLIL